MSHKLISELSLGDEDSKLKCRLARIWDCTNPKENNRLISVDFLLVDEKGSSIQGTIRHQEGNWLKELVSEGNIYLWTGFTVIPPKKMYRACANGYCIYVSRTMTKVENISSQLRSTFPCNSFNFVDYQTLSGRLTDTTYLSDVIGELTSMGSIEETISYNVAVPIRNLELKNAAGITIAVTLWGDAAYQLDDVHVQDLTKQGCIIIVIAGAGITRFRGNIALTSKSGTRVYLNLAIPETDFFHHRLKQPTTLTFTQPSESPKDRMLKNRKTIAELSQLVAKDNIHIKFTCKATISDIDSTKEWWFPACPHCKSTINDENGTAWCNRCRKVIDEAPDPWYKIKIAIADDTGDLSLVIFGKHVERLVKHTASDLAKSVNASSLVLPQAIIKIIGLSRIFELEIWENQNFNNYTPMAFKVTAIFQEEENPEKQMVSTPFLNNGSKDLSQSEIDDASSTNQKRLPPLAQRSTMKIEKEDPKTKTISQSSLTTKRKYPSSTVP